MEEVNASAPVAHHSYATFWRRLSAFIIDNALIHLLFLPFVFMYIKEKGIWDLLMMAKQAHDKGFSVMDSSMGFTILFGSFFNTIVIMVVARTLFDMLYNGIWEASKYQATPG
ncbi:MAG TPA: RDD family protein, partial [Bacteroidia bacterium]|nr:RDD family protein [Bacteroidia bacterium]